MANPIRFYTKTDEYASLSNFAPHGLTADGVWWPTVEHYFQAQKFEDPAYRERIRKVGSPKDAKTLGRSRAMPIRPDWDDIRESVMMKALRLKFEDPKLRALLIGTKRRELIENSLFDRYWGCGRDGSGKNRLGQLLMQLRTEFAAKNGSA